MEPRPQRPSRATGPYISTGTPSPSSAGTGGFGQGAFDASSAPPAPPPAIGYDPDYSPGQPLTPLRGPRGANIVGPLLAVAALAIIVAAVAFIVSQFREDGGNNGAAPTVVVGANGTPGDDDENPGATGGDDDATEEPSDNDDPTEDTNEDENAEPSNTPRVNRPTETDEELAAGSEDPTEEPADSGDTVEKTKARQWLPTASEIGDGYEQSDNGSRDAEGVAGSFPDPVDAAAKLEEFGWLENSYRQYELTGAAETDTQFINVSVHKFDSETGAKDALSYFANGGQTAQGLTEVDADKLGEGSIYLQGPIEGGNVFVIYVRQGEFVFRIGGLSTSGDPAETTTAIAERIIEP